MLQHLPACLTDPTWPVTPWQINDTHLEAIFWHIKLFYWSWEILSVHTLSISRKANTSFFHACCFWSEACIHYGSVIPSTECFCFMPFHLVLLDPLNGNPIKLFLFHFKSVCSTLFYASTKKAVIVIMWRQHLSTCFVLQEIAAYLITFEKHDEWLTTSPKTR